MGQYTKRDIFPVALDPVKDAKSLKKNNIYTTKGALCAQKLGNGTFYQQFF